MNTKNLKAGQYVKVWIPNNPHTNTLIRKLQSISTDLNTMDILGCIWLERILNTTYMKNGRNHDMTEPIQQELERQWVDALYTHINKPKIQDPDEQLLKLISEKAQRVAVRTYFQSLGDTAFEETKKVAIETTRGDESNDG